MEAPIFEKILGGFFNSSKNPFVKILKESFQESRHDDYLDFLDDYLFKYGVNSIIFEKFGPKRFSSYVSYSESNLFDETSGITPFDNGMKSSSAIQEALANHLFSRLSFVTIEQAKQFEQSFQ